MSDLCDVLAGWTPPAGRFAAWSAREPILAGYDLPTLTIRLLDPATEPAERDALLIALVRLAREDPDAATAVVVCLLPGVRRHAHRLARTLPGIAGSAARDDVCAEMIAQTLAHVRTYDLTRRPERIAANVVLDAMSHTLRTVRVERAWHAATRPLEDAASVATAAPDDPDPLLLAVDRGVLTAADAALISATRHAGLDLVTVARLTGVSYECAKKRRQRAEASFAAWYAPERCVRRPAA